MHAPCLGGANFLEMVRDVVEVRRILCCDVSTVSCNLPFRRGGSGHLGWGVQRAEGPLRSVRFPRERAGWFGI
jgi:hypothetical protein